MITCKLQGDKKLIAKLNELGKAGQKIVEEECRADAKAAVEYMKPLVPKDTGRLRRSLTVRKIKKKKRYTVGFRIISRGVTGKKAYLFVPNYGVKNRKAGKQPAHNFMRRGQRYAAARLPDTLKRIAKRVKQFWTK